MDPNAQKLKEEALELFRYSKSYWQNNYEKTMKQCYKAFKRKTDPGYPLYTNLFIPYSFANVQTVLSRLMDAVFSSRSLVSFVPTPKSDAENCRKVEKLINSQFEKMGAFWSFYSTFMTALIYGFSPAKILWEQNAPKLVPLDIWEFYFDPSCEWDLQKAGWVIQRNVKTLEQLEKMVQQGVYQADPESLQKLSSGARSRKELAVGENSEPKNAESKRLKSIEVLECWIGDRIITIAGGDLVLRNAQNPFNFYPFINYTCNPFPHEPVGEGLIAPSLDLQKEINNQRNLRLDLALKLLRPQWKIIGDNIDEEELVWTPDGLIHLNPGEDVQPMLPPNTAANSFQEENRAYLDIDRAMGVTDILRGEIPSGAETATGVMTRFKAGATRIGLQIYSAGRMIEGVTEMMLKLNRKYLENEKWLDPLTQKLITMSQEEILGPQDYKFVPICNTTPLKEVYRQQLMMFFNLLRGDPNINQRELLENLLENFDLQDKEKLLKPLEQSPAPPSHSAPLPVGHPDPVGGLLGKMAGLNPGPGLGSNPNLEPEIPSPAADPGPSSAPTSRG